MVTCDSNATEYMQCEGADVMKAMVIGSAMWNHLLKCITGEAEPVATLHHAAGAVADAWRCYEAAGVSR